MTAHLRPTATRAARTALAGAAALVLLACGSSKTYSVGAATTPPPVTTPAAVPAASPGIGASDSPTPAVTDSSAPAAADVPLRIAGFSYDPASLTVAPGQTVAVTNTDAAEHTVTSDEAELFGADDITTAKTGTFTAPTTPGSYPFHCEYHSQMHGTLIVKGG